MTVDRDTRMPVPAPRNLVRIANASKKFDAGLDSSHDQVDERGFLLGRVIVISLKLGLVTEKINVGKKEGSGLTRKMLAQRWQYRCSNKGELRDEARRARKVLGQALPESAVNKRLRDQSARVLSALGLGEDFPVFFGEDMVLLEGYARHQLDRSCPGLPLEFRAFLARFRRHVLPMEQFSLLFDTLGSDVAQPMASPAIDYLELLFPPSRITISRCGTFQQQHEVEREVIVCVNAREHDTDLGSDGLLPSDRAPAKYLATSGACAYGEQIAGVERDYRECHRKCVSDDRITQALAYHRVICVFRRPRR